MLRSLFASQSDSQKTARWRTKFWSLGSTRHHCGLRYSHDLLISGTLKFLLLSLIILTTYGISQLESFLDSELQKLITTQNLYIDWKDDVLRPDQYVEKWRVSLWKKAYGFLLSATASPKFHKGSDLLKIEGGKLAGYRLLYRYLSWIYSCLLLSSWCNYGEHTETIILTIDVRYGSSAFWLHRF